MIPTPATDAQKRAVAKYDAANVAKFGIKLNRKTDADIIAALEGKPKQTELKRLVRLGLQAEANQK